MAKFEKQQLTSFRIVPAQLWTSEAEFSLEGKSTLGIFQGQGKRAHAQARKSIAFHSVNIPLLKNRFLISLSELAVNLHLEVIKCLCMCTDQVAVGKLRKVPLISRRVGEEIISRRAGEEIKIGSLEGARTQPGSSAASSGPQGKCSQCSAANFLMTK